MGKQLRSDRHRAMIVTIVDARTAAGMTQRDLAAKMKRYPTYFGKVEAGEHQLDVLEFWEVADALGIDPKVFFGTMVDHVQSRSSGRKPRP